MGKVEEKVTCQYCGKEYSKAGIVNHEKACTENPENKAVEEVAEVTPTVVVNTQPLKKEKLIEVKIKESIECYIGDKYYRLKKGEVVEVPVEVKDILKNAGLLEAL